MELNTLKSSLNNQLCKKPQGFLAVKGLKRPVSCDMNMAIMSFRRREGGIEKKIQIQPARDIDQILRITNV